jgi:hypothetical protein
MDTRVSLISSQAKCLSCKMLQSSSSTMRSLSQMSDEHCYKDKSKYNKGDISLYELVRVRNTSP